MRYFHSALLAAAVYSVPFAQAGATAELLSQQTLSDWEFVTASPADLGTVCTVGENGVLAITGKPVGYIATRISHENYQLHFEWRWPADAAKNCNGGLLIHISSGPAGGTAWPVCFQMQFKMDRAGDMLPMAEAKFAEKLTTAPGAKTPTLERGAANNEKPLGEWNSGDVVSKGDSIEVRVNGVLQNQVTRCAPAAGKIGFQLEGAPFELRNVRITPLAESPTKS
jgi:hypothetical protein